MEKLDNNLFMEIGNWFFTIGFHYKAGGIKAVYNHYNVCFKLKLFKWRYKHNKKFRDKIISNNSLGELFGRAVIETIFFNKPIDYKYFYDSLGEKEKVEFKERMKELRLSKETLRENGVDFDAFKKLYFSVA